MNKEQEKKDAEFRSALLKRALARPRRYPNWDWNDFFMTICFVFQPLNVLLMIFGIVMVVFMIKVIP